MCPGSGILNLVKKNDKSDSVTSFAEPGSNAKGHFHPRPLERQILIDELLASTSGGSAIMCMAICKGLTGDEKPNP